MRNLKKPFLKKIYSHESSCDISETEEFKTRIDFFVSIENSIDDLFLGEDIDHTSILKINDFITIYIFKINDDDFDSVFVYVFDVLDYTGDI